MSLYCFIHKGPVKMNLVVIRNILSNAHFALHIYEGTMLTLQNVLFRIKNKNCMFEDVV